jgi:hypothetical protein
MFKFKLIGIDSQTRTLTYKIHKLSSTKLIIDTLFILFSAGFGLIYYYFEDEPIGYEYLCTIKGYTRKSVERYVEEKFLC